MIIHTLNNCKWNTGYLGIPRYFITIPYRFVFSDTVQPYIISENYVAIGKQAVSKMGMVVNNFNVNISPVRAESTSFILHALYLKFITKIWYGIHNVKLIQLNVNFFIRCFVTIY